MLFDIFKSGLFKPSIGCRVGEKNSTLRMTNKMSLFHKVNCVVADIFIFYLPGLPLLMCFIFLYFSCAFNHCDFFFIFIYLYFKWLQRSTFHLSASWQYSLLQFVFIMILKIFCDQLQEIAQFIKMKMMSQRHINIHHTKMNIILHSPHTISTFIC